VIVNDVTNDPRFFAGVDERSDFHTRSILAVPLRVRDTVVGVMEVVNKRSGDFDEDDRTLAETLAASAAIATENARLVQALRQRTADLETRNEALDAFAHLVAHDLKTPVSLVVGFAELVAIEHATMSDQALENLLRRIVRHGHKLKTIVDELLKLFTVPQEKITVSPLDMSHIVAGALERLSGMIETYQAEIHPPETWPAALGYAQWVEEVWENYISNALKYGGSPPRVVLGAEVVSPSGQETREMVRFWVQDNGAGLSSEEQARLFKPFTRLNHARSGAEGHGLGLSIVRRIVEKLGGQVAVESAPGQGSVFSFTLPAAED
jgi:signal transduction histidine kinase